MSTRQDALDAGPPPDARGGPAVHRASASRRVAVAVLQAHRAYLASDVDAGLAAVAVAEDLLGAMDVRALAAHAEVVALVALGKGRLLLLAGELESARVSIEVATRAASAPGCEDLLGASLEARAAVEVSDGRLALASELFMRAQLVAREARAGATPGSAASAVVGAWGARPERGMTGAGRGDDFPSWRELWLDAAEADLSLDGHRAGGGVRRRPAATLRVIDADRDPVLGPYPEHAPWRRPVPAASTLPSAQVDRVTVPLAGAADPFVESLTTKETEVLARLADFLSTEQIAASMYVSVNTVRTHIRSILRKLGVSRRNEAVRRAWDLHLLPMPAEAHASVR